ncbi:MAG: hypothetical protein H0X73_05155 [Chthoniobacterales bacterium]|nr:hypothetical protein [Chthoniobacterales bacterium]
MTCAKFEEEVDENIYVTAPEDFYGVGHFCEELFAERDAEVRELLSAAREQFTGAKALPNQLTLTG